MNIKKTINDFLDIIKIKSDKKVDQNTVLLEIIKVQDKLTNANNAFNIVENKDLIEAWIYEIEGLEVRLNYLIKKAKRLGLTNNELLNKGVLKCSL